MNRVYGYIRISNKKQESGVSREEQKSAISRYAQSNNLDVIEWFVETRSASTSGRPLFTKILQSLNRGNADGVIVHKLDRSARNGEDWSALMALYEKKDIIVGFAHSGVDISTRSGRLSAEIEAVFAADYSRNLREEVKKGLYGRLKQGLYPFAAPVGYKDTGRGKLKAVDPQKAPLVRELFKMCASGSYSQAQLRKIFNQKGLTNVKGNPLCKTNISRMLRNPFYMGIIKIQKTGNTFIGKHTPLISEPIFKKVQAHLDNKNAPKTSKHEHIFKGLIRCFSCQYVMSGTLKKGRYYFRCIQKLCGMNTTREEDMDLAFQQTLDKLTLLENVPNDTVDLIKQEVDTLALDKQNDAKAIKLSEKQAKLKLTKLTDLLIEGVVDELDYTVQKEKICNHVASLKSKYDELVSNSAKIRNRTDKIIELLISAKKSYLSGNLHEKREVVKLTTSNLFVSAKTPIIELKKPLEQLLKFEKFSIGEPLRTNYRTLGDKSPYGGELSYPVTELAKLIVDAAIEMVELDLQ